MKAKFFYLFILLPFMVMSQKDKVIVNYKSLLFDDWDVFGSFLFDNGKLITSEKESIYIETPLDTLIVSKNIGECSSKNFSYKYTYYKDLEKQVIYQDRNYGFEKVISDDNYKINWKITGNSKIILNYKCLEAKGTFRGREYKAYYIPEIEISNGPFKFDGLPGLILDVESTDSTVKIIATDITLDNTFDTLPNPFNNLQTQSWTEFIKFYETKFNKTISQSTAELEYYLPNRYIEYFIKK